MFGLIHLKPTQRLCTFEIGKNEGATLLCADNRSIDGDFAKGYFIKPTIFGDTTPNMRIVQEEIFGSVLVIQTFKAEEEAIELANGTALVWLVEYSRMTARKHIV